MNGFSRIGVPRCRLVSLFSLLVAKTEFEKNHSSPDVIKLDCDTKVANKENTSNRYPNGDFDNSWMKYWMAFSDKSSAFVCSIDGKPIWVKDVEESCRLCREKNRLFELMYFPHTDKSEETYNKREAHGAHVKYNGKLYIVPMCASENTSLKDAEKEITLKAGTILVEEVDPIIDED